MGTLQDPTKLVRNLCHRMLHANWMAAPDEWYWRRPDGAGQGFGRTWRERPGLANLLWLAMDLEKPPAEYDAHTNTLHVQLLMHGETMKVNDLPLIDLAGTQSLREFERTLAAAKPGSAAICPLLQLLAQRRIRAYP